jgi:DNA repair exonuclease SbcCD nuclease subunit
MRFAVLSDTHWGVRNDNPIFYKHYEKFYDYFFAELDRQQITTVIQLGDLFDRRKYINFRTLSESRRVVFDRLIERGITMYTLVGNHDLFFRDSVELSSADLLLQSYPNVITVSSPQTITLGNTACDIIPWICKENEDQVREFIAESKSDLCFGHFEIATFSMYRGVESHDGLPVSMFAKYEKVISGHYHTRSERDNIVYPGTPYEMTWSDADDPKGFSVFDTDTRRLDFYQNPDRIFVRIVYDDTQPLPEIEPQQLVDRFVRVVVVAKNDLYKFDQFMSRLYGVGCFEIKVVEDLSEFSDGEVAEDINLEDTMDVLSAYIDSIDTDADKTKIKRFVRGLYLEALNAGVV